MDNFISYVCEQMADAGVIIYKKCLVLIVFTVIARLLGLFVMVSYLSNQQKLEKG